MFSSIFELRRAFQFYKENSCARPTKNTQKAAGISGEARQQAAKMVATNRQYIYDVKAIKQKAPEILLK